MSTGTPLDRLRWTAVPEGAVGLSWLGQAGFILRSGATTALLDPFLSPYEGRVYESGLAPAQAEGVDVVLCTHEHIDHFDAESAPAIAAASPGAVFVVPTPIVDMVTEAGIAPDRVVALQPGDVVGIAGLSIRAVPAMHGVTMEDAYGFGESLSGGLVRFLGYVVDAGDVRLYHAGDTIHFEGMETTLREAAWLAKEIAAGVVLPMHYDLFERNRGYPAHLVESVERDHPGVPVLVPVRDEPFVWSGGRPR
jgi:L-ascorbate metabolism protein UlaG (beta-lactamase superfamily)